MATTAQARVREEYGPFGPVVRRVDAPPTGAVLWLHGNGRLDGSPGDALPAARRLALGTGLSVLCADYRFAFPAALDDVREAYEQTRRMAADAESGDGTVTAVIGRRLGGGLAAGLLVRLRDQDEPQPRCAVLVSALLDFTLDAPSLLLKAAGDTSVQVPRLRARAAEFAGGTPRTDPHLSPLHANLHGLPALRLHVAGTDPLLDDTLTFATQAAHSGVPVDLQVHPDASALRAWPATPAVTEALTP